MALRPARLLDLGGGLTDADAVTPSSMPDTAGWGCDFGLALEPDPKVVERYQYVVIQPLLERDGMDHDMDCYRSGGA